MFIFIVVACFIEIARSSENVPGSWVYAIHRSRFSRLTRPVPYTAAADDEEPAVHFLALPTSESAAVQPSNKAAGKNDLFKIEGRAFQRVSHDFQNSP